VCVIWPNKWVNFLILHKFWKETRCFLWKVTQLEKIYTTAGRDGCDKFHVWSRWVIFFFGLFLVIPEVWSSDYKAKSSIFEIWVFWVIFMRYITLIGIDIHDIYVRLWFGTGSISWNVFIKVWFLLDPSPIIVFPCHKVTVSFTNRYWNKISKLKFG